MPARKIKYCRMCNMRVYAQESRRKRKGKPICRTCEIRSNISS